MGRRRCWRAAVWRICKEDSEGPGCGTCLSTGLAGWKWLVGVLLLTCSSLCPPSRGSTTPVYRHSVPATLELALACEWVGGRGALFQPFVAIKNNTRAGHVPGRRGPAQSWHSVRGQEQCPQTEPETAQGQVSLDRAQDESGKSVVPHWCLHPGRMESWVPGGTWGLLGFLVAFLDYWGLFGGHVTGVSPFGGRIWLTSLWWHV